MAGVVYPKRPSRELELTLPDLEGVEIHGPGELSNELFYELQSKATKVQPKINPETGEQEDLITYYDPYLMAWNLTVEWITHRTTWWNLTDADGNVLSRTKRVLSETFSLPHVMYLAGQLQEKIWSQEVAARGEANPTTEGQPDSAVSTSSAKPSSKGSSEPEK